MAIIETLSAYTCTFNYLQRNNPLKKELHDKIKAEIPPDYTFVDFINDFSRFTASLAVGKGTERAILLPENNVYPIPSEAGVNKWRIAPYAGKQGKPFKIIKTSTGKEYNFSSDSAALYGHNIFVYENESSAIAIFHRQNGSGCKSVFLEVANKMLRTKGMRLDMELHVPLISASSSDITPTKIQLQYVRQVKSSDAAENVHKRKKPEIIQELGLNLESAENTCIKKILQDAQMGKINRSVAFVKIKEECPNSDIYNDAEILLRVGKRQQRIRWNDFESIIGNYDITDRLHEKFKLSGDFIGALTALSDEYYKSIITGEDVNAG